jgi:hypothetical protein
VNAESNTIVMSHQKVPNRLVCLTRLLGAFPRPGSLAFKTMALRANKQFAPCFVGGISIGMIMF